VGLPEVSATPLPLQSLEVNALIETGTENEVTAATGGASVPITNDAPVSAVDVVVVEAGCIPPPQPATSKQATIKAKMEGSKNLENF
jgi:hypothetical protein